MLNRQCGGSVSEASHTTFMNTLAVKSTWVFRKHLAHSTK